MSTQILNKASWLDDAVIVSKDDYSAELNELNELNELDDKSYSRSFLYIEVDGGIKEVESPLSREDYEELTYDKTLDAPVSPFKQGVYGVVRGFYNGNYTSSGLQDGLSNDIYDLSTYQTIGNFVSRGSAIFASAALCGFVFYNPIFACIATSMVLASGNHITRNVSDQTTKQKIALGALTTVLSAGTILGTSAWITAGIIGLTSTSVANRYAGGLQLFSGTNINEKNAIYASLLFGLVQPALPKEITGNSILDAAINLGSNVIGNTALSIAQKHLNAVGDNVIKVLSSSSNDLSLVANSAKESFTSMIYRERQNNRQTSFAKG